MRHILIILSLFLFSFISISCSSYRIFIPEINESPREGLIINDPILFSIFDARSNKEDSEQILQSIKNGLKRVYSSNLVFVPYFQETPEEKLRIKLRLMACGAEFGSRILTGFSVGQNFTNSQIQGYGGCDRIIGNIQSQNYIFSSNISTEGWWVGTVFLYVEVEDLKYNVNSKFKFPLVSETKEWNWWGYGSANDASKKSWGKVSASLIYFLDDLLQNLRKIERKQLKGITNPASRRLL